MINRFLTSSFIFLSSSLLVGISFFKVNFIWGSKAAFFSAFNMAGPLLGNYANFSQIGLILLLVSIAKSAILHGRFISVILLSYHIPTFCAALYWRHTSFLTSVVIPLICMILFIMHPVGMHAFFYSAYWLIPGALYYLNYRDIFSTALGSTFVAHAVGSVIWIYTIPFEASIFKMLMPIVLLERMIYALGMTLLYHVFQAISRHQLTTRYNLFHKINA